MDVIVSCPCGHEFHMSEFAVGMRGRCPSCKESLQITLDNVRPIGQDAPPRRPTAPDGPPIRNDKPAGEDCCARCKRPFRGEWDMHDSVLGTVCHICNNLIDQESALPGGGSIGYVPPVQTIKLNLDGEKRFGRAPDKEPPELPNWVSALGVSDEAARGIIWVVAIAVVAVAAFFYFTDGMQVEPPPVSSAVDTGGGATQEAPLPELPQSAIMAGYSIMYFCRFLLAFLSLYVFLTWTNRLPNQTLGANVVAVGVVSIGVALLGLFPCIGWLLATLLVFKVYDLGFFDLVKWFLAQLLMEAIVALIRVGLMGVIAKLYGIA